MRHRKNKIREGDVIYYLTEDGIKSDIAMMVDGQEITTSDYGFVNVKDCLSEDDPRVVEYIKKNDCDVDAAQKDMHKNKLN